MNFVSATAEVTVVVVVVMVVEVVEEEVMPAAATTSAYRVLMIEENGRCGRSSCAA